MNRTTTHQLAQQLLQEEQTLVYAQQIMNSAGFLLPVPGNTFSSLLALKMQSEDRYLTSLQRREVLKSRLESQRRKLQILNQLYGKLKK